MSCRDSKETGWICVGSLTGAADDNAADDVPTGFVDDDHCAPSLDSKETDVRQSPLMAPISLSDMDDDDEGGCGKPSAAHRRRPFFSRFGVMFNGLQRRGTVRRDRRLGKRFRQDYPHVRILRFHPQRARLAANRDRQEQIRSTIRFADHEAGDVGIERAHEVESRGDVLLECQGGVENSLNKHRRWEQIEGLRERLSNAENDSKERDTVLLYEHDTSDFHERITIFEPGVSSHPSGRWSVRWDEKSLRRVTREVRLRRRPASPSPVRPVWAERCSIWRRCHRQTRKHVEMTGAERRALKEKIEKDDMEKELEVAPDTGLVLVDVARRRLPSAWPAHNEMKRAYWRSNRTHRFIHPDACAKGSGRKAKHKHKDLLDRLTGHL